MAGQAAETFFMRPMAPEDIVTLSLWFERLADLTLFDSQSTLPVNEDILKKDWEKAISGNLPRSSFWFGIEDTAGTLVGLAGIEAISYINGDCVLPIILASKNRQQGLGLQIAAMLIDMAFDELRLNRVTTYYRADNKATKKLITALGFTQEGCMRQAQYSRGNYHDQIVVGLLASEWNGQRAQVSKRTSDTVKLRFGREDRSSEPWPQHNS